MTPAGRLSSLEVPSAALGESIRCSVYEPPGAPDADRALLVLLHGRGGTHADWHPLLDLVDGLADPPVVLMPDAPWLARSGYYVDSRYAGVGEHGRPLEQAFAALVGSPPPELRVAGARERTTVAGISMGGAGALRLVLAHPELAGAALVLSPAVYVPQPPLGSSTRLYGAFGRGAVLFDPRRYAELSYPSVLAGYPADQPLELFVASGSAEPAGHSSDGRELSITEEAHALADAAASTAGIHVEHRVFAGGHDWDVWRRALAEGLAWLDTH